MEEKEEELKFNPVDPWAEEKSEEISKLPKKRTNTHCDIPTKENIIKALEVAAGHTVNAASMFTYPNGRTVPIGTFHGWMNKYDIIKYPRVVKVSMAKNCLNVMYKKAVKEKDIRALENILNKWGKFIGFEESKDSMELAQLKACKVLYDTYRDDE